MTAVGTWWAENTPRQLVRFRCHALTGRRVIHGRPYDTLASYTVAVRVGCRGYGVTVPCRQRSHDPGPTFGRVTWCGGGVGELRDALGDAYIGWGQGQGAAAGPEQVLVRTPDGEIRLFDAGVTFVRTVRGWEAQP